MSEENNSVASNEVASEIQHEAESQGWVPKERFRGNEADWVDADIFVKDAVDYWCKKNGYEVNVTTEDFFEGKPYQTCWLIKK